MTHGRNSFWQEIGHDGAHTLICLAASYLLYSTLLPVPEIAWGVGTFLLGTGMEGIFGKNLGHDRLKDWATYQLAWAPAFFHAGEPIFGAIFTLTVLASLAAYYIRRFNFSINP